MEAWSWIIVGGLNLFSLGILFLVLRNARHFAASNRAVLGEAYAPYLESRTFKILQVLYGLGVLTVGIGSIWFLWYLHLTV